MSVSPNSSGMLKIKGAVAAAFLTAVLFAALPFSSPTGFDSPNTVQSVIVAYNETNVGNAGNDISVLTEAGTRTSSSYVVEINNTDHDLSNFTSIVQTGISIDVRPNPIALGNTALFTITVSPPPPTLNDLFSNLTLSITRPDGTAETLGPFQSEPNGLTLVYFMPDLVGSHGIQAAYGGQFFAIRNVMYLGAQSSVTMLSVLTDEISGTQRTWIVDDDGPADFHTIQAAINEADNGDTIKVLYGVYREHVVINKTLSLKSLDKAVIDASGDPGSVVKPTIARWNGITMIAKSSTVSGFIVRNGANSGIEIKGDDCTVQNNICEGSSGRGGISLYGDPEGYNDIPASSPRHNVIIGNTARDSLTGLFAKDAHGNTVINNVFETNKFAGIYLLSYSSDNTLTNNTVSRSTRTWSGEGGYGIVLGTGAENNLFMNNTISNNPAVGFAIDIFGLGYPYPYSNKVYHNNFYGNAIQAYDNGTDNSWDNGYPSGGNYWSNYYGLDANGDGIGDSAYAIDVNDRDRYPLMSPSAPTF